MDDGPKKLVDIPEPDLLSSKYLQTPDPKLGQGSDLNPPTHPNTSTLMSIQQQSQETFQHFWARFLLVKNKIKDCRDEEAISVFRNNCRDEGILNAINRRCILHFADLATIVQKYSTMESAWKTQATHWESSVPTQPLIQEKRVHPCNTPGSIVKKYKSSTGRGTVLEGWLDGPDTSPTYL